MINDETQLMTSPATEQTAKSSLIQRIDWGFFFILLMSLFALIPLMTHEGLSNGSDVLYHTYRVGEMDRSWTHGDLFPHWAEGLYFGYGSPLFHFYASLTYYLSSIFIRLFSLTALDALRLIIVISFMLGSGGMYLFARKRTSKLGGIIAGLVYIYSPYLLYTEPYARGTYPELLAFGIFPLVLWRVECLLDRQSGFNFLLVVMSIFLLIHAHNLMALTLTVLLIAWLIFELMITLINRRTTHARLSPYVVGLLAVIMGMGLAAHFWLAVLLESDTVSLQNLTIGALLEYQNFFEPIGDLLSGTPINDAGAINGLNNVLILGLAQWILALVACLVMTILYIRGYRTVHPRALMQMAFFALMSPVLIFLMTPTASFVWETIRALSLLQFPWRFLGAVGVCLAILASINALWIERLSQRLQMIMIACIIALPIITVVPLFYVPEWRNIQVDSSISAYHAAEMAGLQMGTTFTDEYRPNSVYTIPNPTQSLIDDYADGYPVDKFNRGLLPAGAELELISNQPEYLEWKIRGDAPFTAEIYNFYWAGWQAQIDGQAVEITPSANHGLITFPIPAGAHTIGVFLGSSPARDFGNIVSLISLILIIIIVTALTYRRNITSHAGYPYLKSDLGRVQWLGLLIGGFITLIAVFALYREGIAWLNSPAGTAIPAQVKTDIRLDDSFRVIGYDINSRTFHAGDRLIVRVYWYAPKKSDVNFSSFLHVSTGGPPVAQIDKLHPAGRAIKEWWSPDGYILDEYDLYLPDNMAAGEYLLYVGLYTCELMPIGDCGNGYRPTVTDESGEVIGDTIPLGVIEVQ